MPHDLHHALMMTGSNRFLRSFDFSFGGFSGLPVTIPSLLSVSDVFRVSFALFFIGGCQL
jgi:hypothetical protein